MKCFAFCKGAERGRGEWRGGERGGVRKWLDVRFLAPAEFPTQRLGPGHCKIARAHRESALDHHLGPVPPPTAPPPTKFEPPALAAAAGFLPPEVARHPQLNGPRAAREAADGGPTNDRSLFVPDQGQAEMGRGPADGLQRQ
jgi:hypothetical protein